jgi:rubrerythrin
MTEENEKNFLQTFALLSRSAARKKIYSLRALKEDKPREAHLLRALSESESAQARRILNMLKGKIDSSAGYIATIFNHEIKAIVERYTVEINSARDAGLTIFANALSQLREAESRLGSYYSQETQQLSTGEDEHYFICQFCGYLCHSHPPDSCPVCGALKETFQEVR